MTLELQHDLRIHRTPEERAREGFVSSLRAYVLIDLAGGLRQAYETRAEPAFAATRGQAPASGEEVHAALGDDPTFRFYSSIRVNAQEMVWATAADAIERERESLASRAAEIAGDAAPVLKADFELPANVDGIEVHLAPGGYTFDAGDGDVAAGALYDNGLAVFSFGMMGANLDDIGHSFAQTIRVRHPEFAPRRILDLGCTIGHNTSAWKSAYPNAEVTGVDVSAPALRYAAARSKSQGLDVRYEQMNATQLDYPDESFDVVFSSMFLHELPPEDIRAVMREARRVLKPGGLMLHMELPPNDHLPPFDAFYLDWDSYYNNEPFYKAFRDLNYHGLCTEAGFASDAAFEFVTPQYTYMDPEDFRAAQSEEKGVDSDTGRLSNHLEWFGFGAWKEAAA
ncbi:MAG: class I SAM-dependent methyltransferase [Pseudomonadota bacterium]